MQLVPILDVESEVDMEILVVIVVKYAVWLPGLPPFPLEGDARMINYSVVIDVHQH